MRTAVIVEYVLGFAFGWMIFQALFMREMAGGSYSRSLTNTIIPELLSMNLLMAGMVPTVMALRMRIASGIDPWTPAFWFVMSIGLLVGFVIAYPMNWWLVANHLKHGMMTVRPASRSGPMQDHATESGARDTPHVAHNAAMAAESAARPPVPVMALLSFATLAAGLAIAFSFGAGRPTRFRLLGSPTLGGTRGMAWKSTDPPRSAAGPGRSTIGASSSLPPTPAKVALPNRQLPFRLGGWNWSLCPI
jgi:hypothetical protein